MNLSVGASYYFGKNKSHADWTPTVYGGNLDLSMYDLAIKELQEKTKDDDKDGVPNYLDEEPATIKGSYVDSKGKAMIDTDQDGIVDAFDLCPTEKGTYSTDGCPDSDGDGVPDKLDVCPDVAGIKMNKGCPEIEKETKEVLHKALKDVQFKNNEDVLLASSYPALDAVVKVLSENAVYRLDIEGHTDDIGNDQDNIILSHKRAEAVAKYVASKGIDFTRLDVHGHGESRPKVSNDTPEGKAINRRVEFKIVF
jgi:outer membrane protein OmpA-like peptidoglycan-associated protein